MKPEEAFSLVLRRLRAEVNITQEQLAFESHLDRSYISLLERGLRQPTLGSMLQLATALKVSPSILMKYVEELVSENQTDC